MVLFLLVWYWLCVDFELLCDVVCGYGLLDLWCGVVVCGCWYCGWFVVWCELCVVCEWGGDVCYCECVCGFCF